MYFLLTMCNPFTLEEWIKWVDRAQYGWFQSQCKLFCFPFGLTPVPTAQWLRVPRKDPILRDNIVQVRTLQDSCFRVTFISTLPTMAIHTRSVFQAQEIRLISPMFSTVHRANITRKVFNVHKGKVYKGKNHFSFSPFLTLFCFWVKQSKLNASCYSLSKLFVALTP